MNPTPDLKEHAEDTCIAVLGDERVLSLMTAWAGYAKQALDARGLSCMLLDDDLTWELAPFGRQYVLGMDVWDAEREFAWRLRLEFFGSLDPNVVGHTELTLRFGVGRFDPDSELDTWSTHPLFSVGPAAPMGADVVPAKVLAGQVLTKFVQWHNRQARDVFVKVALQLDDALLP